ncbi:MAG: capsule assembly Wzi family protein [Gammaproteobacteria bacterium]
MRVTATGNSAYPRDANNGSLWAGRGFSGGFEAGVRFRYGVVSGAIAPGLFYQRNRSFSVPQSVAPGVSPFAYPWHGATIDWPTRHGSDHDTRVDLGQSFVRVDTHGLTFGLSNENLWWGPALQNPILFSNTAPGFPHAFFGLSRPVDIAVGRFEAEMLWGLVRESDFFDIDPDNDRRLVAAVITDFEPRGLPGLYLGIARTYMATVPAEGFSLSEYIFNPYRDVRENPDPIAGPGIADNQILSFFGRWAFPEVGFEVYAEWARDDHWTNGDDFIKEPDHSQVYTIGLQKVVEYREAGSPPSRWLRLRAELTHLEGALPLRGGRGIVTLYTNSSVPQGHSHRGQLLGAAIGPGSDAQLIGADLFTPRGRFGIYAQRIRFDDDAYYANFANVFGRRGHDVELTFAARGRYFVSTFDLDFELNYSPRYNRNFDFDGTTPDALFTDHNLGFLLTLAWRPTLSWPAF